MKEKRVWIKLPSMLLLLLKLSKLKVQNGGEEALWGHIQVKKPQTN